MRRRAQPAETGLPRAGRCRTRRGRFGLDSGGLFGWHGPDWLGRGYSGCCRAFDAGVRRRYRNRDRIGFRQGAARRCGNRRWVFCRRPDGGRAVGQGQDSGGQDHGFRFSCWADFRSGRGIPCGRKRYISRCRDRLRHRKIRVRAEVNIEKTASFCMDVRHGQSAIVAAFDGIVRHAAVGRLDRRQRRDVGVGLTWWSRNRLCLCRGRPGSPG